MRHVQHRFRWRFFRSSAGHEPVREFLDEISDEDAARIAVSMKELRITGLAHPDVNHLRGDIWQLEVDGLRVIYRLLFAQEGRYGQVLLALEVVNKKWQKAKQRHLQIAENRLSDWRRRGYRNSSFGRPRGGTRGSKG